MAQPTVFKFLDSYSKEDGPVFFGRESETEEIYQRCSFSKTLVVYGRSGTGKTSIIRCGLGNAFDDQDWLPVFVRRSTEINRDTIRAIRGETVSGSKAENSLSKELRNLYLDHFKPVYLIFDQFEELFIFGGSEEIETFFASIKTLIKSEQDVHLIFVIREEYLAYLTEAEEVIPEFLENRIRIEHLTAVKLRETVEKMCEAADIELEDGFSEELTERMTSGKAPLELSYLQVYLDFIRKKYPDTNRFSKEMIEALGSFGDVLGDFLQRQLNDQPDPAKAETVLKAFVSAQGTKRLIDTAELKQLTAEFGLLMEISELDTYVNRFIDGRILRQVGEDGKYELRHDTLAKVIYERITLAEKELLEAKQFVHNAYNRFQKNGTQLRYEDLDYLAPYAKRLYLKEEQKKFLNEAFAKKERRQKRKLRLTQVGVGILLLLLIGAGYLLYQNYQETQLQARIDESHRLAKLSKSDEIGDPMLAFLLAEKAHEIYEGPHTHNALLEAYDLGKGVVSKYTSDGFIKMDDGSVTCMDFSNDHVLRIDTSSKIQRFQNENSDSPLTNLMTAPYTSFFSEGYLVQDSNMVYSLSWSNSKIDSVEILDFGKTKDTKALKTFKNIGNGDMEAFFVVRNSLYFLSSVGIFSSAKDISEYPFDEFLFKIGKKLYWKSRSSVVFADLNLIESKSRFVGTLIKSDKLVISPIVKNGHFIIKSREGLWLYKGDSLEHYIPRNAFANFIRSTGIDYSDLSSLILEYYDSEYIIVRTWKSILDDGYAFSLYIKIENSNYSVYSHSSETFLKRVGDCFLEYVFGENKLRLLHRKEYVSRGTVTAFQDENCLNGFTSYTNVTDLRLLDDHILILQVPPVRSLSSRIFNAFKNSNTPSYPRIVMTDIFGKKVWEIDLSVIADDSNEYYIETSEFGLFAVAALNQNCLDLIVAKEDGKVVCRKRVCLDEIAQSGISSSRPTFHFLNDHSLVINSGRETFIVSEFNTEDEIPDNYHNDVILTDFSLNTKSTPLVFGSMKKKCLKISSLSDNSLDPLRFVPFPLITPNHRVVMASDTSGFIFYAGHILKGPPTKLSFFQLKVDSSMIRPIHYGNHFFPIIESEYVLFGLSAAGREGLQIDLYKHDASKDSVAFGYQGSKMPLFTQVNSQLLACIEDTVLKLDLLNRKFSKIPHKGCTTQHRIVGNTQGRFLFSYGHEEDYTYMIGNKNNDVIDSISGICKIIVNDSFRFLIPEEKAYYTTGTALRSNRYTIKQKNEIYTIDKNGVLVDFYSDLSYSAFNESFFEISDFSYSKRLVLDHQPSHVRISQISNNKLFEYFRLPKFENSFSSKNTEFVGDRYILTSHRLLNQYELFPINGEVAIEMVREQGRLGEVRDFTKEEIEKYQLN